MEKQNGNPYDSRLQIGQSRGLQLPGEHRGSGGINQMHLEVRGGRGKKGGVGG